MVLPLPLSLPYLCFLQLNQIFKKKPLLWAVLLVLYYLPNASEPTSYPIWVFYIYKGLLSILEFAVRYSCVVPNFTHYLVTYFPISLRSWSTILLSYCTVYTVGIPIAYLTKAEQVKLYTLILPDNRHIILASISLATIQYALLLSHTLFTIEDNCYEISEVAPSAASQVISITR